MQSDESAQQLDAGHNRSTASETTDGRPHNPRDWRPETVTDLRRALLDGETARSLAGEYPAGKDVIQSLAKHGRGTGEIGPLRALSTTGRWVPADAVVADGGYDIDPHAWYVLDILDSTVVAGPHDEQADALWDAREYGPQRHIIEFGEAIQLLRETADGLERNGHVTVSALDALEDAKRRLATAASEQSRRAQEHERRVQELIDQEGMIVEEAREEVEI